jgi:hypothetical protein
MQRQQNKELLGSIREMKNGLAKLRGDKNNPKDISMSEYIQTRFSMTQEVFYHEIGINPSVDTISLLENTGGFEEYRFLIPEVLRDAVSLGLRKSPIYPKVIASEQTIPQHEITLPHINMSDAAPYSVGEGETIPLGSVSFGQKTLKIGKIGRGLTMTYEVKQFVALNILAIFLQDFGVKLGHAIDTLMIDVLINGEQANGSESAPVVGVAAANTLTYKDLLKVWIRMGRLGKRPSTIIAGEDAAIETWDLDEFKLRKSGNTDATLRMEQPVPNNINYFIHGAVPDDQSIIIDPSGTVIKYNAQPLLIEMDKKISNQTHEAYASLTTGFGIVYRDSRVIVDSSLAFSSNGFPTYMDVDALEVVNIL